MKKTRKLTSLFLIVTLLITTFSAGFTTSAYGNEPPSNTFSTIENPGYVPGQLLVGMKNAASLPDSASAAASAYSDAVEDLFPGVDIVSINDLTDVSDFADVDAGRGARSSKPHKGRQILLVELASDSQEDMLDAIETLEENPLVAYAEPNMIGSAISIAPNDTYFDDLWGMMQIQAPEAWELWEENKPGTRPGSHGTLVGVLDTGVDYNHPDLAGNVDASLGYNFLYDNPYVGWWYPDPDPMDDNGHGTHVSGTIGAVGDNNEGVVGVCWDITVVPLKIWDGSGNGSEAEFISALYYADSIGISILNISGRWFKAGWPNTDYQAMRDAVDAYSGVLVAAAGNESWDNDSWWDDTTAYPASFDCDNIISVAASYTEDELVNGWWGSNYGASTVDLAAPGEGILSSVPWGGYDSWGGTSMAAPHVAGTAALLKAYRADLTTAEIKSAILDNVDYSPYLDGMVLTNGRLNTYKALESIIDTVPPVIPVAEITGTVLAYCPAYETTITLLQGDDVKYQEVVAAAGGIGQVTQNFKFEDVAPGTYTLVIKKPGHLSHTKLSVEVGTADVELGTFTLIAGDINGDGVIDEDDLEIFIDNYLKTEADITNQGMCRRLARLTACTLQVEFPLSHMASPVKRYPRPFAGWLHTRMLGITPHCWRKNFWGYSEIVLT